MVDLKTLKQLVRLMKDNELSELDIRDKDEQVTLKRGGGGGAVVGPAPVVHPVPPPSAAASQAPAPTGNGDAPATSPTIDSPMVGTFYAAPSPDAEPFVRVGSQVSPDTVVCVIEAMKVFNEIKCECSGTITKVLVKNGQAVEFGQPLFEIKQG